MSWSSGITRTQLERAAKLHPPGVKQLAAFVGAEGPGVNAVLRACERHRAAQNLQRVRGIDRRAK